MQFFGRRSGGDKNSLEYKDIKASIHHICFGHDNNRNEYEEIQGICDRLKRRPSLIPDTVVLIKVKIKDPNAGTSCTALKLLDRLVQTMGVEFREHTGKRLLSRILKIAIPNRGKHPQVQRKAANLIMGWAAAFGSDPHFVAFKKAAMELAHYEESSPPPASKSCEDLSKIPTKDLVAVARLSQDAIMQQITSAADIGKIKNLLIMYHQLDTDINAHYMQKFSGADKKTIAGLPNLRASSVNSGLRSASIASPEPAGQLDLSALCTHEVVELAQVSQAAIMQQLRVTDDARRAKELAALYRQLTADLAAFWARA